MQKTLATFLLFASCLWAAPSDAATLNISSGSNGILNGNVITQVENDGWVQYQPTYSGTLAAHTTVTFKFSVSDGSALASCPDFTLHGDANTYSLPGFSYVGPDGSYSYNVGVSATLNAYGSPVSTTGSSIWGGYNKADGSYVSSYYPVTALLMSPDKKSGSVTISNMADFAVWYKASLDTEIQNLIGNIVVKYTTSDVPLPAALPLFGAGLLGLGWLSKRRARRAV